MLLAETNWADVFVIIERIVIVLIPLFTLGIGGYLEYLRRAQATQAEKLDRVETKTDQQTEKIDEQTEKIEDAQKERLRQTGIIVGAAKETAKVVEKLTESKEIPQKVEVVNEPLAVVEEQPEKRKVRKK